MEVVSSCPLRSAAILWQPRADAWMLTVVCKATYVLAPVESDLAPEQDAPNEVDSYWDDDESRSLNAASDLAPFKLSADVLLTGHAYAPKGQRVNSLLVRLLVGEIDKLIEVFPDRAWTQAGALREGPLFAKMPLRWERAAGGPETPNPVGVRADAPPDRYGMRAVPNLQPPGIHVSRPGEYIEPIGLGPIAPTWPARASWLYRRAKEWSHAAWYSLPLPGDIHGKYFNAAPPDQQIEEIRNNERIVLENLHKDHPRLVTSLKPVTPRAEVKREGREREEVRLRCDTLSIDTDLGRCTLTWRGQVPLWHPNEAGQLRISTDRAARRLEGAAQPKASGRDAAPPTSARRTPSGAPANGGAREKPGSTDEVTKLTTLPEAKPALPFSPEARTRTQDIPEPELVRVPVRGALGTAMLGKSFQLDVVPAGAVDPATPAVVRKSTPPPASARDLDLEETNPGPAKLEQLLSDTDVAEPPGLVPANVLPFTSAPHHDDSALEPPVWSTTSVLPFPSPAAPEDPATDPVGWSPPPALPFAAPSRTRPPTTERRLSEPGWTPAPALPFAPPPVAPPAPFTPPIAPPAPFTPSPIAPPAPFTPSPPAAIGPLARMEEPAPADVPAPAAAPEHAAPAPAPPPALPLEAYPVERCGAIAASIARSRPDTDRILERAELKPAVWAALEQHWAGAIRAETARGRTALLEAYDRGYVARLEEERGPIRVEEYARLVVALERGSAKATLAELKLPAGAPIRLQRVWLQKIGEDAGLGKTVSAAIEAAREVD